MGTTADQRLDAAADEFSWLSSWFQRKPRMVYPSPSPPGLSGPICWPLLTLGQLEFVHDMVRRFGSFSRFRVARYEYYVLGHPSYVLQVLQERSEKYSKETHDYWLLKRVMGNSLLTGDGDFWKQRRKLIQPAFQRTQLEHLARVTVTATDALIERWNGLTRSAASFDVVPDLVQLTLRIIGQTLFSTDLVEEAPKVGRAVGWINAAAGWNWQTALSLVPLLNWPYRRSAQALDHLIDTLVRERRQTAGSRPDLLAALVSARDEHTGEPLTDREIRNEAMTLMLAGHDTTAHHLAWTFDLLARNPRVVDQWHQELRDVLGDRPPTLADLPQLTYTRMIVDESMRLYPPIWTIPRRVLAEDEFDGHRVPVGSYVLLPIHALQRDARFWPEPEEFRPERFDRRLEPPPPPGAYAPFGWGPRTCVGAQFAAVESVLILARLAQQLTWSLDDRHRVVPEGLITLRPRTGIRIRLKSRDPATGAAS